MHRTVLLLGLLCLDGCGVAHARLARDRERTDIAACQGTYPQARGSLLPLLRCEDAAARFYVNQVAPADARDLDSYAQAVERSAGAVDRGRATMAAWRVSVGRERHSLAAGDPQMQALFAALPAARAAA